MSKRAIQKEEKKKQKLAKKIVLKRKTTTDTKKKKLPKDVYQGIISGKFSFNNTILSLCKTNGEVLKQYSSGSIGFKNTKKSSPYAAQKCTEAIAKSTFEYGIKELELKTKGIGAGRDIFIKQMLLDKNFVITSLTDKTPIAHGGCRPRKCPRK